MITGGMVTAPLAMGNGAAGSFMVIVNIPGAGVAVTTALSTLPPAAHAVRACHGRAGDPTAAAPGPHAAARGSAAVGWHGPSR